MKKELTTKSRIILTILFGITGILLFVYILMRSQSHLTRISLEEEMKDNSAYICDAFDSYEYRGELLQRWSDSIHESYLLMIMLNLDSHPELAKSEDYLMELSSLIGTHDIMMVDREGNVVNSCIGFFKDLKDPAYAPLLKTFETGKMEKVVVYPYSEKTLEERIQAYINTLNEENTETDVNEIDIPEIDPSAEENTSLDDTYYGLSNPFPIFYSLNVTKDLACVINDYGVMQLFFENETNAWNYTLKNEVIGASGFAFVYSADDGTILYYPDSSFRNQNIKSLGIDMDQIRDGEFVTQKVNGTSMYLYPVLFKDKDVWVVCAVPSEELSASRKQATYLMWLIFGILAADLMYYAVLLLRQKNMVIQMSYHPILRQKKESGRKVKLLTFTVFCTVTVFLTTFYLQTLYQMSNWSKNATTQLSKIENEQKEDEILMSEIRRLYQESAEELVKFAEWHIAKYPDFATPERLDLLTSILQLDTLWITDENKTTIAASSSYLPTASVTAEEKEPAPAASDGETKPAENTESTASKKLNICVPLRTDNGSINGYVFGEYSNAFLEEMLMEYSLSDNLIAVQPGEGAFVFTVNKETKKFTSYPDPNMVGKNALDYGLKETDLQDNLCQYIQLNRDSYYSVTGQYKSDIIFMSIRKDKLLRQRLPITLASSFTALILLLLIGIWVYTCPETEYATEMENPEEERVPTVTAEFKVFRNLALGIAAVAAVLLVIRYLHRGTSDDMLEYVLSGNWEHGLNVFALSASLIILLEGGLALFLLRKLTDIMTAMLSLRARTVIRMVASLVSYSGGFIILYRCLVYLGMDPTALMASAGIVSVVIGIGANSLVGDILAGIFLLIEGNIQVGDMISVSGFRGIVEDLGIRMTKIYDVDSEDIKIIPNKEVQNVVHMSTHPANLFLEYQICYEENLQRVEELLVEELKKPDGRIPEMMGDLVYLGVRRLDSSGVVLLVRARCHEAYRPRVTRAVNRKVYLMFKRNGIDVPFPQLTVHEAEDYGGDPEE